MNLLPSDSPSLTIFHSSGSRTLIDGNAPHINFAGYSIGDEVGPLFRKLVDAVSAFINKLEGIPRGRVSTSDIVNS